jgi:hypothetical protein
MRSSHEEHVGKSTVGARHRYNTIGMPGVMGQYASDGIASIPRPSGRLTPRGPGSLPSRKPTVCSSNDSARILSYQELPTSIQCGEAIAKRRKEDSRAGIASRGMVQRLGRFSSRVDHRVVPDRGVGPERCSASGSAMDACSDTTT